MTPLVLFAALLGVTSARPGIPHIKGRENVIAQASSIQNPATIVPIPVSVMAALPEDRILNAHTVGGLAFDTESHLGQKEKMSINKGKKVLHSNSDEHKILMPANPVLSPGGKPLAPRQLVFTRGFPIRYVNSEENIHSGVGKVDPAKRVVRQVLGSPVWDQKVVDWAAKDCPPGAILGGAVGGASGGPLGVLLGVAGAAIGSCNFN